MLDLQLRRDDFQLGAGLGLQVRLALGGDHVGHRSGRGGHQDQLQLARFARLERADFEFQFLAPCVAQDHRARCRVSTMPVAAPVPGFESLILSVTGCPFITLAGPLSFHRQHRLGGHGADRGLGTKVDRRHAADLTFGRRHQLAARPVCSSPGLSVPSSQTSPPCGPRWRWAWCSISCGSLRNRVVNLDALRRQPSRRCGP